MAKPCKNMRELRQMVAEHYGKKPVQFTMYLPSEKVVSSKSKGAL